MRNSKSRSECAFSEFPSYLCVLFRHQNGKLKQLFTLGHNRLTLRGYYREVCTGISSLLRNLGCIRAIIDIRISPEQLHSSIDGTYSKVVGTGFILQSYDENIICSNIFVSFVAEFADEVDEVVLARFVVTTIEYVYGCDLIVLIEVSNVPNTLVE